MRKHMVSEAEKAEGKHVSKIYTVILCDTESAYVVFHSLITSLQEGHNYAHL